LIYFYQTEHKLLKMRALSCFT